MDGSCGFVLQNEFWVGGGWGNNGANKRQEIISYDNYNFGAHCNQNNSVNLDQFDQISAKILNVWVSLKRSN